MGAAAAVTAWGSPNVRPLRWPQLSTLAGALSGQTLVGGLCGGGGPQGTGHLCAGRRRGGPWGQRAEQCSEAAPLGGAGGADPARKALGMARGTASGQRVAHVSGTESGRGGCWVPGARRCPQERHGRRGDQAPAGPRTAVHRPQDALLATRLRPTGHAQPPGQRHPRDGAWTSLRPAGTAARPWWLCGSDLCAGSERQADPPSPWLLPSLDGTEGR